jgi:hypothetical protein
LTVGLGAREVPRPALAGGRGVVHAGRAKIAPLQVPGDGEREPASAGAGRALREGQSVWGRLLAASIALRLVVLACVLCLRRLARRVR